MPGANDDRWTTSSSSIGSGVLAAHFAQARSDAAATAAPATGAAGSTGSRQPGETLAQQFDAALDIALAPRVPTDSKRRLPSVAHKAVARASTVDVVDGTDAELEWVKLQSMLSAFGLAERPIEGDGACQFRAISDQLFGNQKQHLEIRRRAIQQLQSRPDLYAAFAVAESFPKYLARMSKVSTWGDNLTLQAVADTFNVQIHLLTTFSTDNVITVAPLEELQTAGDDGGSASSSAVEGVPIWLGFYAEFHYVSIEQI